jgi:hypothetical protein
MDSVFTKYVLDLFERKKNAAGSLAYITKSLLNNLIGRLGLNIFKPITRIVTMKFREYISMTRPIKGEKYLPNNKILLTYSPIIDPDICEAHGLDYIQILEKDSKQNIEDHIGIFKDISISTAAMVNSYARIYMNQIKLNILKNGGSIFYTDTDSLVIDEIG